MCVCGVGMGPRVHNKREEYRTKPSLASDVFGK